MLSQFQSSGLGKVGGSVCGFSLAEAVVSDRLWQRVVFRKFFCIMQFSR